MTGTARSHTLDGAALRLNVYTAAAGTPTADALTLLASWAATHEDATLPTV